MTTLDIGSEGYLVKIWQRIAGVPPSKVDGKFGIGTQGAVHAWQLARGVDGDGVIGPLTRAALEPGDGIKPYEGLVLVPYDDAQDVPLSQRLLQHVGGVWRRMDGTTCRGWPTIGWGRKLQPGEVVLSCTRAEADLWFNLYLNSTDMPTVRKVGVTEPGRVLALCSFGYNGGPGAILKLAKVGFSQEYWLNYAHDSHGQLLAGLVERRREEWAMWNDVS